MPIEPRTFAPGVRRLSWMDTAISCAGASGAALATMYGWWISAVIVWVVVHFLLFCNIFRIARPLELSWGGVFVALAASTMVFDLPGWLATFAMSLVATLVVIAVEMRKPSYHGVGWQTINPNLRTWWEADSAL